MHLTNKRVLQRLVRLHIISELHWRLSPSRHAIASSSTRTASMTGTTGRASKTKAGSVEQNLWTVNGSSQSPNISPPQSPTRTTNISILKLSGAFHCVKTSRIRFWVFSYSIGDPCGRSYQLIMYFIGIFLYRVDVIGTLEVNVFPNLTALALTFL